MAKVVECAGHSMSRSKYPSGAGCKDARLRHTSSGAPAVRDVSGRRVTILPASLARKSKPNLLSPKVRRLCSGDPACPAHTRCPRRQDKTRAEPQPGECGTAAAPAAPEAAAVAVAGPDTAAKEAAAAEAGEAGKEAAPDVDASSEAGGSESSGAGSTASRPLLRLKQSLERIGDRTEQSLTGLRSDCSSSAVGAHVAAGSGGGGSAGLALSGHQRGFRLPAALLLVVLGVVLTLAYYPDVARALSFGPSAIQALVPSAEDWRIGILQAGLPQLALTSFNSVISVCQLAGELFPDRPASPDHVAFSVGAMNMVGCWFGAMPSCHGAGGLAAQARFGARTGAAPIFLGLVKLSLGLLFGSSLLTLLKSFPSPLLGAMLVFAGIQLAACGANQRGERGVAVLLLTAVVTLGMGNVAIGVVAGLAAAYLLLAWDVAVERCTPLCRRVAGACGMHRRGCAWPRRQQAAPPVSVAC